MSDNPITVDIESTLKSAGAESISTNGTGKAIGPTGLVKCQAHVTGVSASDTLDLKLQQSSDDGVLDAYTDIPGAVFAQIVAAGVYTIWFKATEKWVRYVSTLGGSSISINYAVYVDRPGK